LYVHDGQLYIFFEAKDAWRPGWIESYVTKDLTNYACIGEVLREPHHLSYPVILEIGTRIFMIPESRAANEVALYEFGNFPRAPRKIRSLLKGAYVDTSPVKVGDIWFLFSTSNEGLELFYTDDLVDGRLIPHPLNPLTNDPHFRRCGGIPLRYDGRLYRVAQNCSDIYGGNINLMEIQVITPTSYVEKMVRQDIFQKDQLWNRVGSHHISVAKFKGKIVVAVDGQEYDYYLHKIIRRLHRDLNE
jgi:hypothetical protein